MLLTVTNLRTSPISFLDSTGQTATSFTVPGSGAVTDKVVTSQALEGLEAQLIKAATAAHITWTVKDDPGTTADSLPLNVVTSTATPYTAAAGDLYIATNKVAASAHSVVLSAAAPIGQQVSVVDLKGDAATNNVTVTAASGTINGGANIVLNANRSAAVLTKVGATAWVGHRITV